VFAFWIQQIQIKLVLLPTLHLITLLHFSNLENKCCEHSELFVWLSFNRVFRGYKLKWCPAARRQPPKNIISWNIEKSKLFSVSVLLFALMRYEEHVSYICAANNFSNDSWSKKWDAFQEVCVCVLSREPCTF